MKVSIKTDPETLFLLHHVFKRGYGSFPKKKHEKVEFSLMIEVFTQLTNRCMAYQSNPTGKKISMTFKYHLANFIWEQLQKSEFNSGIYETNKLEMFKNELHQKLL